MLPRCLVTAARVALVSVSIDFCVTGGEKSSFTIGGPRGTFGSNTGVYTGSRRGGGAGRSTRLRAIRGGNGGPVPSFGSGVW